MSCINKSAYLLLLDKFVLMNNNNLFCEVYDFAIAIKVSSLFLLEVRNC